MPIQRRPSRMGRVAENIQGVIDAMLKAKIAEQSQARQAEFAAQRQRENNELIAQRQREQAQLESSLKKEQDFGELFDVVGGAKDLQSLPVTQALVGRGASLGKTDPHFKPGIGAPRILGMDTTALPDVDQPSQIHQLVAARRAKEAELLREAGIADQGQKQIGPGGVEGFFGRGGEWRPTQQTGTQIGSNKADELLSSDLRGDIMGLRVGQKAAETAATTNADISTQASMLDQIKKIADAKRVGGATGGPLSPLAEMASKSPDILQTLDSPTRSRIMAEIAASAPHRDQFESVRLAPIRERAQSILTAIDRLVDPTGALTPGAIAIFGEYTPAAARGVIPGAAATDASAALKQVLGQQIVELIANMKAQSRTGATGFGQLNAKELDVIESAATQLTQRLSEPTALKELLALQSRLRKILLPGTPTGTIERETTLDALEQQFPGAN